MDEGVVSGFFVLVGVLIGGAMSFVTQSVTAKLANRTAFRAEETLMHYLSNKEWFDRDFETLKAKVGGFEDNELRQLLVRAGAVRVTDRDGDKEWWTLLSRGKARRRYRNKRAEKGLRAN